MWNERSGARMDTTRELHGGVWPQGGSRGELGVRRHQPRRQDMQPASLVHAGWASSPQNTTAHRSSRYVEMLAPATRPAASNSISTHLPNRLLLSLRTVFAAKWGQGAVVRPVARRLTHQQKERAAVPRLPTPGPQAHRCQTPPAAGCSPAPAPLWAQPRPCRSHFRAPPPAHR